VRRVALWNMWLIIEKKWAELAQDSTGAINNFLEG